MDYIWLLSDHSSRWVYIYPSVRCYRIKGLSQHSKMKFVLAPLLNYCKLTVFRGTNTKIVVFYQMFLFYCIMIWIQQNDHFKIGTLFLNKLNKILLSSLWNNGARCIGLDKSVRTPWTSHFGNTKISTSYESKELHYFRKCGVWEVAPKFHL